jgi:Baseplate J-like protein
MSVSLPLLFNAAGPVATPPATIQAQINTLAISASPGLTSNLPGALIEDVLSTEVAGVSIIDQTRVDSVNAVAPGTANPYILAQLGTQFGLPQGLAANGSVLEVFTGSPGYVIARGTVVGDGTNQYVIQDGGTCATDGDSQPLQAIATSSATFPIPANTVNQVITAVPSPFTLTVTNPVAGVSALAPESTAQYRSRILQAWNPAQGVMSAIKTRVLAVPGVSPRLVSVQQVGTLWEVICGGGDPYQVAGAIYTGAGYVGLLAGSQIDPTRDVPVTIFDAPDYYEVIYVAPPAQAVTCAFVWNTALPNFTSGPAVDQYLIGAGQAYFNSILVGQPINLMALQQQAQAAVAPVLAVENLSTLLFTITINTVEQSPTAGTSLIPSDPESYFQAAPNAITSVQG